MVSISKESKELEEYLYKNEWEKFRCEKCNRLYWTKSYVSKENCQELDCLPAKKYIFSSIIRKKRRIVPLYTLFKDYMNFFKELGYKETEPNDIYRGKDTFFIICGLQKWDDILEGKRLPDKERYVFNQPSVRLTDIDKLNTGRHLTAFNMLSIQQFDVGRKDYVDVLDHILQYYSDVVGLPVHEMTLVEDVWRGGNAWGPCLETNIGGVEIGTLVYIVSPIKGVDVGLGLERIGWVLSKSDTVWDVIGPIENSLFEEYSSMNTLRTVTLLIGQNILPSKKGAGYVIRKLIKDNLNELRRVNIPKLTRYYYDEWSKFIKLYLSENEVENIIEKEIDRELLAKVSKIVGYESLKKLTSKNFEEFIVHLHEDVIPLDMLRKKIKES
ncbi:MAG: alanine--tRNA ligase-related protein [Candidatus Aenigmatarchaeota archaeon]